MMLVFMIETIIHKPKILLWFAQETVKYQRMVSQKLNLTPYVYNGLVALSQRPPHTLE